MSPFPDFSSITLTSEDITVPHLTLPDEQPEVLQAAPEQLAP